MNWFNSFYRPTLNISMLVQQSCNIQLLGLGLMIIVMIMSFLNSCRMNIWCCYIPSHWGSASVATREMDMEKKKKDKKLLN